MGVTQRFRALIKGDHICPDLVNIGFMGKVIHIGGIAAGWTHVHFQTDDIAGLTQTFHILGQTEELQVEEAASCAKSFHGLDTGFLNLGIQILNNVVQGVHVVIDNIHQAQDGHIASFKQDLTLCANDAVIGADIALDHLFHDVGHIILGSEEIA